MLLHDYNNGSFSLGDVQFALGIVLSNLGEDAAAKQVISFLGTNKVEAGRTVNDILEERSLLDDALHHVENVNIVNAFINYLCNTRVFVSPKYSQIQGKRDKCTLIDIVQHTASVLYEETMKLLFNVESNMLLYHYMFTPLFMKNFKITIMQMIRKSKGYARIIRRGGLSDSDYAAILNDFSRIIRQNSCNGSYNVNTGDPDAFLCSAPLRKWYPATPGNEYFNILHGHGQDSVLDDRGDGTTVLDLKGITDKKTHMSIDFGLTCAEIAEASKLLFTHNSSSIAFYDILSFHRERKINTKKNKLNHIRGVLNGITIDVVEDTLDDTCGDSESIRNKFCGRRSLCEIMEAAFSSGIMAEDLYPLYRQLLRTTACLHTKNGQRLFCVDGQNTKQIYTNGQIFHVLVNGYNSLYRLLSYLNSPENTTGVTEDSFPVKIFRDKRYLKRFKSMEEYVKAGDVIFELMDEVSADSQRRLPKSDGFYSNDEVYDILCESGLSFNSVLGELGTKPISFIALAVSEVYASNQDSLMLLRLDRIRMDLDEHGFKQEFLTGQYRDMSYAQALVMLDHMADLVQAVYKQGRLNFYTYHDIVSWVKLLVFVMQLEGTPVVDENDVFIVTEAAIPEIFLPVEKSARKYKQRADRETDGQKRAKLMRVYDQLHGSYLKRILCCCNIFEMFTGIGDWHKKGYKMTRIEFHDMLCINDILFAYLKGVCKMLRNMASVSDANDLYLALISLVQSGKLLRIPDCITDMNCISFLYEEGCSAYLYADLLSDLDALKTAGKKSSSVVLAAFNRFFKRVHKVKDIFNHVYEYIGLKIRVDGSNTGSSDYEIQDLLKQENEKLAGLTFVPDEVRMMRSRIRVLVGNFDDNGYARIGSRLMTLGVSGSNSSFVYLHKSGYATMVDRFNHLASSRVMTEMDISMARNTLIYNG